ncbi:elongin c, putative [Eimeria acervulina]|uniref:Elongin-C n=1 Tax=Eimeria acervulina TaxID=5801 RepID=U6GL61_EIMAC|nr:elongin c, putative [Eimeria acervulina]CDI80317.1 elongin c, putative [Eimeria acervulina]
MSISAGAEETRESAESAQGAAAGKGSSSFSRASQGPCGGPTASPSQKKREDATAAAASSASAAETVRLISMEGKAIDVPLHIAEECELLKRMLSGTFTESRSRELQLQNIRYNILCKAVEYLRRRHQWREEGGAPLEFEIEPEIAVDLLIAADYLGMK